MSCHRKLAVACVGLLCCCWAAAEAGMHWRCVLPRPATRPPTPHPSPSPCPALHADTGRTLRLCYLRHAYGLGEHYESVVPGLVGAGSEDGSEEQTAGEAE